jgi:hypothetical protein
MFSIKRKNINIDTLESGKIALRKTCRYLWLKVLDKGSRQLNGEKVFPKNH